MGARRFAESIAVYLRANAKRFRVRTVVETRVRASATRYRIPDICCVRRRPAGGVITDPILGIEILSPEDSFSRLEAKIADYLDMGVPRVWVIDPENLDRAFIYEPNKQMREVTDGVLTAGEIYLNLRELPAEEDFE